jgi:hypothetical protein
MKDRRGRALSESPPYASVIFIVLVVEPYHGYAPTHGQV